MTNPIDALKLAREAMKERRAYCEPWEYKYGAEWDNEDGFIQDAIEKLEADRNPVDDKMKIAIQVQENLSKVSEGEPFRKYDFPCAIQVEWNDGKDHRIVMLPTEGRDGIGIYLYTDGLNTARLGLSTLAALYLYEGVEKVVIKDRAFLDKLREKKEALANSQKP